MTEGAVEYPLSEVALAQFEALQGELDDEEYENLLDALDLIIAGHADARSATLQTQDGLVRRLPVPASTLKVFWRGDSAVILAILRRS